MLLSWLVVVVLEEVDGEATSHREAHTCCASSKNNRKTWHGMDGSVIPVNGPRPIVILLEEVVLVLEPGVPSSQSVLPSKTTTERRVSYGFRPVRGTRRTMSVEEDMFPFPTRQEKSTWTPPTIKNMTLLCCFLLGARGLERVVELFWCESVHCSQFKPKVLVLVQTREYICRGVGMCEDDIYI